MLEVGGQGQRLCFNAMRAAVQRGIEAVADIRETSSGLPLLPNRPPCDWEQLRSTHLNHADKYLSGLHAGLVLGNGCI